MPISLGVPLGEAQRSARNAQKSPAPTAELPDRELRSPTIAESSPPDSDTPGLGPTSRTHRSADMPCNQRLCDRTRRTSRRTGSPGARSDRCATPFEYLGEGFAPRTRWRRYPHGEMEPVRRRTDPGRQDWAGSAWWLDRRTELPSDGRERSTHRPSRGDAARPVMTVRAAPGAAHPPSLGDTSRA